MTDGGESGGAWRGVLTATIALVLWPTHFAGSAWLSFELFRLAGGVTEAGRWTRYGAIDYAWTNLAWLPGGLLLSASEVSGAVGFLLVIVGSGIAAYMSADVFARLGSVSRPRFGQFAWRLWLPLLLWLGWVPVPVKATLTYWHTVAY